MINYPDPALNYDGWRKVTQTENSPTFVELLCQIREAVGFTPKRILDFGYGWGISSCLWLASFRHAIVTCCDPSGQGGYAGTDPVSKLPLCMLRRWTFIHGPAENVLKTDIKPFDFIFIDADHKYETTLEQIELSWDKLLPGGVMAGHDWKFKPVERAVCEFANANDLEYRTWDEDNGGWMIRKKGAKEWATIT